MLNVVVVVVKGIIKRNIRKSVKLASKVTTCSLHNTRGQFHRRWNEEFLRPKIPKAQKDANDLTVFLRFWDLCV